MIDVHAHINYSNFPRDNTPSGDKPTLDTMINHAKNASIQHIVAVSESIHDAHDIFEIASASNNFIWPARGLHPVQCDDNNEERSVSWNDFETFEPLLQDAIQHKEICCIGEGMLSLSYANEGVANRIIIKWDWISRLVSLPTTMGIRPKMRSRTCSAPFSNGRCKWPWKLIFLSMCIRGRQGTKRAARGVVIDV